MVGTVLVFRDLRREHEVEQMKTEFLSRVGHELRTPLTGIMGYAEILLRRDVPPERTRSWHDEILQSARRLLRIVEMLEFFASSGAGRMTFRREPVDIGALVNGVTSSWSSRLPGNVSIGRKVERGTPTLMGDRRWLTMAVDELIDNAAKFSPDGGPILVSVERVGPSSGNGTSGSGESIALSVKDRGKGMSADELAVAFSDFAQADNSDTRRFGGLGLGLAVVRRVVEGHGGEVKCRSAVGSGSTFTIVLPVTERPAEEAAAERRTFRRQQRRSPTAPSAPS
jgi:signal transduction histidine kinase